jgi:hypothetical protein
VRLTPGARLGPYEVVSVLGAGGMSEVYRARDTRLGRDIALKVVNESLAGSPELVHRFEHEARIAGSLNHPNLVAVYDFGLHDGSPYFITELLQGESLRHRLSRGRLPVLTALDFGAQMAHGLAAAHGRGVIHRDVKPDKVFIDSDGLVKLLDFGIAKLAETAAESGHRGLMDVTVTPTGGATRTGSVLGTPGYMAPEQVRGEPVDARTDIFSLGSVLYEMLCGQRAFPGASVVESGYEILHNDPEPLPAEVPPAVAQVVERCLQKDPGRRFHSASDLAFALEILRNPTGSKAPIPAPARPRWRRLALPLLAAAVVASLSAILLLRGRAWVTPTASLDVEQVNYRWGAVRAARFAPDGRIIFSAAFDGKVEGLYSRTPGSPEAQSLGLENVRLAAISRSGDLALLLNPRFSRSYSVRGTLARVGSVGGTPRELQENVEFADWSPTGELAIVHTVGSSQTLEYPTGHVLFRTNGWISNPRFSGRGDRIAFLHHPLFYDDMGEVAVVDLAGQARTLSGRWTRTLGVAWSPDDREVLFTAGKLARNLVVAVSMQGETRELYAAPSDIELRDVAHDGSALVSAQAERTDLAYINDSRPGQTTLTYSSWTSFVAAVSSDGNVLFSESVPVTPSSGQQPVWTLLRKTDGTPAQVLGDGVARDLSSDGRRALILSVNRQLLSELPTGPGQPRSIDTHGLLIGGARWLRDGKSLAVTCRVPTDAEYRLCILKDDGSAPERISEAKLSARPLLHLSPDDRWAATLDVSNVLLVLSMRDGAAIRLPEAGADATPRGWSPEGHLWVTLGGDQTPARARLLRFDLERRRVVEERLIAPVDPNGAIYIRDVVISPDGHGVAFNYSRALGYLHILRGLIRSER